MSTSKELLQVRSELAALREHANRVNDGNDRLTIELAALREDKARLEAELACWSDGSVVTEEAFLERKELLKLKERFQSLSEQHQEAVYTRNKLDAENAALKAENDSLRSIWTDARVLVARFRDTATTAALESGAQDWMNRMPAARKEAQ